jgi:hypothetical protein
VLVLVLSRERFTYISWLKSKVAVRLLDDVSVFVNTLSLSILYLNVLYGKAPSWSLIKSFADFCQFSEHFLVSLFRLATEKIYYGSLIKFVVFFAKDGFAIFVKLSRLDEWISYASGSADLWKSYTSFKLLSYSSYKSSLCSSAISRLVILMWVLVCSRDWVLEGRFVL